MNFDPKVFGEGFHRFVQMEIDLFRIPLGIIFHIATLVIMFLVFTKGNKYRKLFAILFCYKLDFPFWLLGCLCNFLLVQDRTTLSGLLLNNSCPVRINRLPLDQGNSQSKNRSEFQENKYTQINHPGNIDMGILVSCIYLWRRFHF